MASLEDDGDGRNEEQKETKKKKKLVLIIRRNNGVSSTTSITVDDDNDDLPIKAERERTASLRFEPEDDSPPIKRKRERKASVFFKPEDYAPSKRKRKTSIPEGCVELADVPSKRQGKACVPAEETSSNKETWIEVLLATLERKTSAAGDVVKLIKDEDQKKALVKQTTALESLKNRSCKLCETIQRHIDNYNDMTKKAIEFLMQEYLDVTNGLDSGIDDLMKKKRESKIRPWSDLPIELLELISRHLRFTDQRRISFVSKGWRSINGVQPAKQLLPLLITWDPSSLTSTFRFTDPDPFYNKACNLTRSKSYMKTYPIDFPAEIAAATNPTDICEAKHGWLLLRRTDYLHSATSFFFYSPFTNKIIDGVPELATNNYDLVAAFSLPPTSPGCVIIVLQFVLGTNQIQIHTYRLGDIIWTGGTFTCEPQFNSIHSTIYMNNKFYCLGAKGKLGAYDVSQAAWNSVIINPWLSPIQKVDIPATYHMVVSGGKLFQVHMCSDGTRFRYRYEGSNWVEDDSSFGDQVLFLGRSSVLVPKLPEIAKSIRGRYYYYSDNVIKYYSFKAHRVHRHCAVSCQPGKDICTAWIEPPV